MSATFVSKQKRDELTKRLMDLAYDMQRSFDQGHDGRIGVSDEIIGDVLTAAGVVGTAEVKEKD